MRQSELHKSVQNGDIERVRRLLESGVDPNEEPWHTDAPTPLMHAVVHPSHSVEMTQLLLAHGASLNQSLRRALGYGTPAQVAALVDAGADIHYKDKLGYDALIDAVHGDDKYLIEMLNPLVEMGVDLNGASSYNEPGLRVLSRTGRFDGVKILLDAGANPDKLMFSALMNAVVFGSLEHVESELSKKPDLEERDSWERTAWLLAVQIGDIEKAQLLLDHGADKDAAGFYGHTALFYAAEQNDIPVLQWLLSTGADFSHKDEAGDTVLDSAIEAGILEPVQILLDVGATFDETREWREFEIDVPGIDLSRIKPPTSARPSVVSDADTAGMALRLLEAGGDPKDLSWKAKRDILGLPPEADDELVVATKDQFEEFRSQKFGRSNPEDMTNPFWISMIRSGLDAYSAGAIFGFKHSFSEADTAVWCAQRFGQSLTTLPDGRMIQIAGEHEDSYDPDFCIYNDVFVHAPDGSITIYGYPEDVFPPTDFHTATLIDEFIYIIGSLGYMGTRTVDSTPVYRLDTKTYAMESLETTGDIPGWISEHRATVVDQENILVSGGQVFVALEYGKEDLLHNSKSYVLNIATLTWSTAGT